MHKIAQLPEKDRRDLFRTAAQKLGLHEAILEKDFWVCWVLDYLFHGSPWQEKLVFKGGTSLAKAFKAIERFSEDIDLILDWRILGYSQQEPWIKRSVTKQDAFAKEANQKAIEFLIHDFLPVIRPALAARSGVDIEVEVHRQDVFIMYPKAFSLQVIQPQIRLEIGPMAAWSPNEQRSIHPYVVDQFSHLFSQSETMIRTISVERSFWEKATILHQEAHRDEKKSLPPRYSRHYYDLYKLSRLPIREKAIARVDLLLDVAQFKMRFYRCPWALYEEAKPGSLQLLPSKYHIAALEKDYQAMQVMLFGEKPSFAGIMHELADLEKVINQLGQF